MTYKEWSARPDLIERLSFLLRDEVLQSALSVVEEWGLPRQRIRPDSPNLMENNALLNARREGYYQCLDNLRTLAQNKAKPELELAPWKHASEPDL